jgi:demethylmenaquinone methyltransferase/2-methoxy-6-polyprenyl-1,4-benzoquinol methylase
MFDAIAGRYDFLNHLLSLGLDRRWRARAVVELDLRDGERLIDLCTGTGDLALTAAQRGGGQLRIVGVDFAAAMLTIAHGKIRARRLEARIPLVRADATSLPLAAGSCDAASIGFGIRNVEHPERAIAELARVLRPAGRLAILEFGFPKISGIRTLYRLYFRRLLPLIGRAVSRDGQAYTYLPASVEAFQSPEAFSRMLEAAGFTEVRAVPLTLGIVYLFMATRH